MNTKPIAYRALAYLSFAPSLAYLIGYALPSGDMPTAWEWALPFFAAIIVGIGAGRVSTSRIWLWMIIAPLLAAAFTVLATSIDFWHVGFSVRELARFSLPWMC